MPAAKRRLGLRRLLRDFFRNCLSCGSCGSLLLFLLRLQFLLKFSCTHLELISIVRIALTAFASNDVVRHFRLRLAIVALDEHELVSVLLWHYVQCNFGLVPVMKQGWVTN